MNGFDPRADGGKSAGTKALEFTVLGVPQPQGSKTVARSQRGASWVRDDNPRLEPWRDAVRFAAYQAMGGRALLEGPQWLSVVFVFPRPKGHFGTGRNAGKLKASAPPFQATRPDLDKLVRALGDAITGIVVRDDAQLAVLAAEKHYGEPPCAFVRIRPLDELELEDAF